MGSDRSFPWENYTPHADDGKLQLRGGCPRAGLAGSDLPARRLQVTALCSRDQRLREEDTWAVLRYIGPRATLRAGARVTITSGRTRPHRETRRPPGQRPCNQCLCVEVRGARVTVDRECFGSSVNLCGRT